MIADDPVLKAKRDEQSKRNITRVNNPDARPYFSERLRQYNREHGVSVHERVTRKRSEDPEFDSKMREIWGNNGFRRLQKEEWFRNLRVRQASEQSANQALDPNCNWGKRFVSGFTRFDGYCFRSAWELSFYKSIRETGVSVEYEKHRIVWNEKGNIYITDFTFPDLEMVVELKPACFVDMTCLRKLVCAKRHLNYFPILVTERNRDAFLSSLSQIGCNQNRERRRDMNMKQDRRQQWQAPA